MSEISKPLKAKKGLEVVGDVTLSTANGSIKADLTNSTRPTFMSTVTNGLSYIGIRPNGSATTAGFMAYNSTDTSNSSYGIVSMESDGLYLKTGGIGSGSTLPVFIKAGSVKNMKYNSDGSVEIYGNVRMSSTGFLKVPTGNNSTERPGTGEDGFIRYNNTDKTFEGYGDGIWGPIGSGGSIKWSKVSTNTTVSKNGDGLMVDTSGGVVNITPIASPRANDTFHVSDYAGTFTTNNVTVLYNGTDKLMGGTDNIVINMNNVRVTFVYVDSTIGWKIIDIAGVNLRNRMMAPVSVTSTVGGETVIPVQYTPFSLIVVRNGITLDPEEYTATNGTSVTLVDPLVKGDRLTFYPFREFRITNCITVDKMASANGVATLDSSSQVPANQLGNVSSNLYNWSKSQSGVITTLTDNTTISIDLSQSNNFKVTLAGSRTLSNPTNIVPGQSGIIAVTQDATGSRALAYGSFYKFVGGTAPTLTTTANAVDYLCYYVETSTRIFISLVKDVK